MGQIERTREGKVMNAHLLLLVMAFVCFIIALVDWPPVTSARMIALGLALLTLAELIGAR